MQAKFLIFISVLGISCVFGLGQSRLTEHTLSRDGDKGPPASIDDVSWIAGRWRAEAFGGIVEEIWETPSGGTMMGMFKSYRDRSVRFYEFFIIQEDSGSLVIKLKHFHPDLVSWEEKAETVDFPLVKLGDREAFFEGMTFRRLNENRMDVFLALRRDGSIQEAHFQYTLSER